VATVPSLRRSFSWTLVGNIFYAIAQFVALIVLAKFGTKILVGRYALALAIAAPVFLLASLRLRQVIATDATGEYRFADYLGMTFIMAPLALATVTAVGLLGFSGPVSWVIVGVGMSKTAEAISDVCYGLMQAHERMDLIARSQVIRGLALAIGMSLAIIVFESLLMGVMCTAVLWALAMVLDLRRALDLLTSGSIARPRFAPATLRRLFYLAFPLGLVTVLGSLETNIPRYMVEHGLGEEQLGIFAALAYLLTSGNTIIAALSQASVPRMARDFAEGRLASFLSLTGKLVATGLGLGLAGIALAVLFGEFLLGWVYQRDYGDHADVFVLLMIAGTIRYTFAYLGTAANAMRRFRVQPPIHIASLLAIGISAHLWVPTHGLRGAAASIIVGTSVALLSYLGWALYTVTHAPFRRAKQESD